MELFGDVVDDRRCTLLSKFDGSEPVAEVVLDEVRADAGRHGAEDVDVRNDANDSQDRGELAAVALQLAVPSYKMSELLREFPESELSLGANVPVLLQGLQKMSMGPLGHCRMLRWSAA